MQLSIFDLPAGSTEAVSSFVPIPNPSKADKLKELAQGMKKQIEYYLNPAIARQNPTQRRARIAESMRQDGEKLKQIQGWLLGMANSAEAGTLSPILYSLDTKTRLNAIYTIKHWKKKEIERLLNREFGDYTANQLIKAGLTSPSLVFQALVELNNLYSPPKLDRTEVEIERKEQELIGRKIPDFFPTPEKLCRTLVERADISGGCRVLEPSAGKGDLAAIAQELGGIVECFELNWELVEILKLKGFDVTHANFLELTPENRFDVVIMNPPFSKGADCLHIQQAYQWLAPGGRLVSIASASVEYNSRQPYQEFRIWLEEVGAYIERLPAASFARSFRPTGVQTVMITIDK